MTLTPNEVLDSPKNNALKTGPSLIAVILNWWLFGILFMQYLLYLSHGARKDKKVIRAIVHILFLLDTIQSILVMVDAFHWFVFNFGNYEPLLHSGLPGIDGPILDTIIAMTVQLVYSWRIWVLSKQRVFPIIVAFLALVSGIGGFVGGIYARFELLACWDATGNIIYNVKIKQWFIPAMFWLWASAATDIFIAVTMAYLLKFKSKGCSQGFKAAVKRLLILTLETNTLTAIVAMLTAGLSLFPTLGPPSTTLHIVGGYALGKLYSNCFMVLLNQRIYYEKLSQERSTTELGTLEFVPVSSSGLRSGITNPDTTGEVSIIPFSEAATQVDFKSGHSNDVELGQSMRGLRIIVEAVGAAGKK